MADDAETTSREDAAFMTSAMLKAYSHPLRRQILRLIARRGFLRAADIAGELDVPANSASFHLRVLAEAGLIEEAPEQARDRRDRVWTGRKGALNVGGPENPVPDEALGGAVVAALAEDHQDLVRRVMAWTPEYVSGRTAEVHASFVQRTIRLTEAEFDDVMHNINDVLSAADAAHDDTDPTGRYWQMDIVVADDTI
ncbi:MULTISPECIES: ArsR/SmtB family transcription factor [Actinomycetes]|uniref:ArsR/SmtB family transcription factor n=1 Tax=Actinomycetes TaxID=1760 RepID=UPI001656F9B0|nr:MULTISPECIES: helix-turn-helix domain-containing protein [Microbacterium]MCT1363470.1 helix-turn-helix domain-containing protein [Microbacterium sp. p3-SID131]MCT1377072.1 helix-turn-helix domain-containing protein [Microbacterium sp. p3-SID337]MCZ0711017.1 helix-turn-helix domain-containing protein [Microbacterium paraoxydans]MDH5134342.1 helix-turn-helix domain-containing protein [Microbacterium sp. RD10]MDH5137376.1 helix-turn-helix domain-containing protein [Microbacterium sp. RD11]